MLDWERGIALHAMQGDQASFSPRGKSHGFSRVAAEPEVYSRFTAGMAIHNLCLISELRTPVWLRWIPQESKLGLAGKCGCF